VLTRVSTLILRQFGPRAKTRQALSLMVAALAGLVLTLPPCILAQGAPSSRPAQERHVLVISVDGLGASLYERLAAKIHVSNLSRLRREGSYAEGVGGAEQNGR
jgi:hypothetical protein